MLLLGALVYWKFNLLALELRHLVQLTRDSIENLNVVQQQVTHSEKLVALGRLAAGAAHEISNPLTAIFGYSELLTDIPSLTAGGSRECAIDSAASSPRPGGGQQSAQLPSSESFPNALVIDKKPAS